MRTLPLIAAALAFSSSTAQAGGLGLLATGGMHAERAYYYDTDGNQGIDSQIRPNGGVGGELLLGDKDDKVLGFGRFYLLSDAPTTEPDTQGIDDAIYPDAHEQGAENVGVMTVGIQWSLWGDSSGMQVVLNSLAGSGFVTVDNLEFMLLEVGGGATYAFNERVQAYGNVATTARYRKNFSFGGNAYAGVRYMFD
ncbi:MAG: hypothetical protein QGG40_06410 [Myxococcota bacterium]|jgi:hypothetical protein|nr:hypothetical protein [Myxococcota bacterium]